jgi:putative endopeptidase
MRIVTRPNHLPLIVSAMLALASQGCGDDTAVTTPDSGVKPDTGVADQARPDARQPDAGPPTLESIGLSSSAMDPTAKPCEDFYQYACGGWLKATDIPADQPIWNRSFSDVDKDVRAKLRTIVEGAVADSKGDPALQTLAAYHKSCTDTATLEKAGTTGIDNLLTAAKGIKKASDVTAVLALLHVYKNWALFHFTAEQDQSNAKNSVLLIYQDGLGMFMRDFYLGTDPFSTAVQAAYGTYVETAMKLVGLSDADAAQAKTDVLDLETEIAKASKGDVEMRDVKGTFNKIDRSGLKTMVPSIDWDAYFTALGAPDLTQIAVTTPALMTRINELLTEKDPRVWRNYLTFWSIRRAAYFDALPKAFSDANFAFMQNLTGQAQPAARSETCMVNIDTDLPHYTGKAFAQKHFTAQAKAAAATLVQSIGAAFLDRLESQAPWMAAATKQAAKTKMQQMTNMIGYPDAWQTYDVVLDPASYTKNVMALYAAWTKKALGKVGKPLDRSEWAMSAAMVNAYYDPAFNQMVFPAGILQPPFFAESNRPAVNYGAIGYVMGHELTHGFDDQGSQYDGAGIVTNWWDQSTASQFAQKGQCVVDQYNAYEVLPGVFVDGALCLGENIADMGGVAVAFKASRTQRGTAPDRPVAGFTEDQQFFLSVGQVWCAKARDEYMTGAVHADPHSPAKFRVNGALSNLPEFAAAFSCAPGSKMNPTKQCSVW